MSPFNFMAFLPELALLAGMLVLFVICLGDAHARAARLAALLVAAGTLVAAGLALGQEAVLFDGAYRVDAFSQIVKLVLAAGFLLVILASGDLSDIRDDVQPEYQLFLALHVTGLIMLVSSIELITLVVALETAAFPLYLLVPMRREREGQRNQMEAAIKYFMFGVAANGVMLFGLSYLYGLTGTTSLPKIMEGLQPLLHSPLAITGLALTFCGLFYKLAVFPFHFWTPDVYQGASNETTSLIASLPKVGAVAVLVRLTALATPDSHTIAVLLGILSVASMFYGNLVALRQNDLKRLLAFSGIAHAGYTLIGFTALDQPGYAAALYYIISYLFMILACFVVVSKVSRDGVNVSMSDLAGLHRRSPLLALTLVVGIFGLAGIPPFAGFIGKLALLTAAYARGHLVLVILAVVNTAIAIYYYLCVVREACFRDPENQPAIRLDWPTRVLCVLLMAGTLGLGVLPGPLFARLSASIPCVTAPLPAPSAGKTTANPPGASAATKSSTVLAGNPQHP